MNNYEKFHYIFGLVWITALAIFMTYTIHIEFNFLNAEIEGMQTPYVSMQEIANLPINGVLITPQMARIIQCESGFNQYKLGDKGRAIGLAQFHEDTFLMFQKQSGIKGSIFDAYTQLKVMAWAMDNQKDYHWTCK